MAHYAILDENNIVINVITGNDEGGETDWEVYYGNITGNTVKRTSYNTCGGVHSLGKTPFRKNFAGIGYTYDVVRDAFIPPKPFNSWVLDEDTCRWLPPKEKPSDNEYKWNENNQTWDIIE